MNTKFSLGLVFLVVCGWSAAEVPRKAPLTKYRNLWQNSPFTTKPSKPVDAPVEDVLKDYALAGVSPIKGGHRVTIINKKNPQERIFVYSDEPNASHGFKIESVERKADDMRGTVVHMRSGNEKGSISYDEKFLTIAAPAPVQQQNKGRPVQPNGAVNAAQNNPQTNVPQVGQQPGQQSGQQVAPRAPRPRVIGPPPTQQPGANPNTTNSSAGERPLRR